MPRLEQRLNIILFQYVYKITTHLILSCFSFRQERFRENGISIYSLFMNRSLLSPLPGLRWRGVARGRRIRVVWTSRLVGDEHQIESRSWTSTSTPVVCRRRATAHPFSCMQARNEGGETKSCVLYPNRQELHCIICYCSFIYISYNIILFLPYWTRYRTFLKLSNSQILY